MTKEEAKKLPKAKPHPLLAKLPDYLKDQNNYHKIQLAILEAGATKHSHGEVVDWAKCVYCQQRLWDRKEFMYKLGFKNAAQYKAWCAVHEEIKKRVSLPKYNS